LVFIPGGVIQTGSLVNSVSKYRVSVSESSSGRNGGGI